MTPSLFNYLQKNLLGMQEKIEIAATFFSGTTLSGGLSPGHPRFNAAVIKKLEQFTVKNITVHLADFRVSIPKHNNDFLYCDPPYLISSKLYGKNGDLHSRFDHTALAKLLKSRDGWLLSYNDCSAIRDLYQGYRIVTPEWAYGMSNSKKSNEILIFSKDLQ